MERPAQQELSKFVDNNIYCCQSMLVEHLFEKAVFDYSDVVNYDTPDEDWIEKRMAEMKEQGAQGIDGNVFIEDGHKDNTYTEEEYREFAIEECEANGDMQPQEIFEWYVCSDWLIKQLEKQKEPILHTDYGSWWGRTCAGQSIFLDSVIERIYSSNNL